ncbi:hypothetical protein SAMN05216436_104194 [bacterium A37T11]|nr:hypothetical protein SAMN05216436_104194 [bacterium A37T11]
MNKRTARSGFKHLKDQELLTFGGTVLTAVTGNPYFTTPNPGLTVLETALEDFRDKMEVANRKGSPLDISLKNDSRDVLIEVLKQLAFYVNTVANGSLSVILSSGFRVMALPTRSMPPEKPTRVRLTDWLQSGQARLDFDPVKEAWMYEYQFTDALDETALPYWPQESLTTTRSNTNVLAPLTVGNRYFVRVRARNGMGMSDWTTAESIIAR